MENKNSIEEMVVMYHANQSDNLFQAIYEAVKSEVLSAKMAQHFVRKTGIDEGKLLEMFDEAIMYTIGELKPGQTYVKLVAWKFKALRTDCIRSSRQGINGITDHLTPRQDKDGEEIEVEFIADYNLEDAVTATKKADQRKLIDSLLEGADAVTTAIVEAFLTHPNPTPTAIGKALGIHNHQVARKLKRLAGKFDSKQFGDYRDYLVAL